MSKALAPIPLPSGFRKILCAAIHAAKTHASPVHRIGGYKSDLR